MLNDPCLQLKSLQKNLSKKFGLKLQSSTARRVKIKKGNITGKILNAHTEIAFKHALEQIFGLKIKKMHKIIINGKILFDL